MHFSLENNNWYQIQLVVIQLCGVHLGYILTLVEMQEGHWMVSFLVNHGDFYRVVVIHCELGQVVVDFN